MGGLLYKDFISIRGKRLVTGFSVLTLLMIIIKLIVASVGTPIGLMVENDEGEIFSFLEYLISMPAQMMPIMFLCFISNWVPNVLKNDEKSKIHSFLSAMPVSKRTYIAEKYVFIGICIYICFSLSMVWNIISMAFLPDGFVLDLLMLYSSIFIELFSLAFIGATIEFPVFVAFGKEKGQMIKTAILEVIACCVTAYLFFGDLSVFEKVDIGKIMEWTQTHSFALTFMSVITPLITLSIYYISFRISVRIYERKEREYE